MHATSLLCRLGIAVIQPATARASTSHCTCAARRTYALSRYKDTDRHGRSANRFSRGRGPPADSRSKREASSSGQEGHHNLTPHSQQHLVPQQSSSQPQNPSPNQSWLSSIDSYRPVGPLVEETSFGPPPVAPGDILNLDDAAARILSEPSLVVVRQIEMMNVFLGFEQANRYKLVNARGEDVGFLAEQEGGFGSSITRQFLRGHRPFNCFIMDPQGNIVLRVTRPLSYINSRISISKGADPPSAANKIGECQQEWSPFRRKYSLYHRYRDADPSTHPDVNTSTKALTVQEGSEPDEAYTQFANVDSRMLAWDFYLQSEKGQVLASINRNFMGFGRELFTDTGQYVLRFDRKLADMEVQQRVEKGVGINEELTKAANENELAKEGQAESTALVQVDEDRGLTLDQRAVLLATAMTIDVDYFSRNSSGMSMPMLWMPFPGGGGGGAPAEVPPGAEGMPGEAGTEQAPIASTGGAEDSPFASPEYGESPGIPETPYDFGGSPGTDAGGYDPFGQSSQPDDVMQDPWANNGQSSDDGGGGGFWGFFNDITGGDSE